MDLKEINDGIHNCNGCEHYPCTLQPLINNQCNGCPIPGRCCHALIVIMPCEEGHYESGIFGLNTQPNGDCIYFIENKCSIYDKRPLACRIAGCAWTRKERPMGK
jgi:Fe-S-cluster containining protein